MDTSTETLIEQLRHMTSRSTNLEEMRTLTDSAERLGSLYYGTLPPAKLRTRYEAVVRRLANCRRGLRQLQRAYLMQLRVGDAHLERATRLSVQWQEARQLWDAKHVALKADVERLTALLSEVARSGVEFSDPRMKYVTVQVDNEVWRSITQREPQ